MWTNLDEKPRKKADSNMLLRVFVDDRNTLLRVFVDDSNTLLHVFVDDSNTLLQKSIPRPYINYMHSCLVE